MKTLNVTALEPKLKSRLERMSLQAGIGFSESGVRVKAEKSDAPRFEKDGDSIVVYYDKAYEFFYGLFYALGSDDKKGEVKCAFNEFGVMLDCSRNAVPTVESLKKFVDYLAFMGYNQLQLYTEDTYEIEDEPYFGHLRGRYTREELTELDLYCKSYDIELVPCVQTLAHLNQAFKWNRFKRINDIDDILLVDEPETYEFIEKIFTQLEKTFSSRKVHIGMDEAHNVGRGKFLDRHGYENISDIMLRHLSKVVEIAHAHGFEPMMWSDMFFRLAYGTYYVPHDAPMIDEKITSLVPEGLRLVYWNYYSGDKADYDDMIDRHHCFKKNETVFAGGIWKWYGFAPLNEWSEVATTAGFASCREKGVNNVFLTMWGDDGAECSPFALIPGLCFASDLAYGREKHEPAVLTLTGVSREDFMTLDLANRAQGFNEYKANCKGMLFSDPFFGVYDNRINKGEADNFIGFAERIGKAKAAAGTLKYVFETQERLCRVLKYKYDLSLRTREAYLAGDKKALKKILKKTYKPLKKELEKLYLAFKYQWHVENKPFGFEIQDVRFGGLMLRIEHCRKVLKAYVKGKIKSIPELEAPVLDYWCDGSGDGKPFSAAWYRDAVSASKL